MEDPPSLTGGTRRVHCAELERGEIEQHLSTKTPYRAVANLDDSPKRYPGCHPTRTWAVIRHGTRNPSKKVIRRARNDLVRIKRNMLNNSKTPLCPELLRRLRSWHFNVSEDEQKLLVAEGEDEMIELAERMKNRFPSLFPDMYDKSVYYFKYTATQRTLKSAQSFAIGLFGRHRIGQITYPQPLQRDPVLRFYKLCNRWRTDVDQNPQTFDNLRKFLQGDAMLDVIELIRQRTQLADVGEREVRLMYTICAFETAWQRRQPASVWCQLFDGDGLRALEFAEDLECYWNDGYGYEITQRIACPAVADMFSSIHPQSTGPNATFYFTHSGTLLKLLAHLGLYRDAEPLTHRDLEKPRAWRTSAIDAFASNVMFVLYECDAAEPMVLTLHQERVVRIAGCPADSDLCSLRTLRQLFADSIDECNFDEICQLDEDDG